MREIFLDECIGIADYWLNIADCKTDKEKVEGAIFSIMNIFDGTSGGFQCAVDLVLRPHPDDKKFHVDEGENWV